MTISKTLLRNEIETTKYLIEDYNKESRNFPEMKYHNDKQVLKMMGRLEAYESLLKTFQKNKNINRRVSARHNIKQMKTTTGLTIIHDGNRVNVYTQKEIEQLDKKNDYDNDVIIVLTLSALLITIGLIIGLSV